MYVIYINIFHHRIVSYVYAVTTPAHNETGSGIDCFGERTVLTNCKDEERVRLFYFNKDNNSCQDYMGCPLEENETTLNVFSNRESCKENCPGKR